MGADIESTKKSWGRYSEFSTERTDMGQKDWISFRKNHYQLEDMLTKYHMHSIMVFGYKAADIVEPTTTNLHVDLAHAQQTYEFVKGRYHGGSNAIF